MEGAPERIVWIEGFRWRWMAPVVGALAAFLGLAIWWLGISGTIPPSVEAVALAIGLVFGGSAETLVVAALQLYLPFNRRVGVSTSHFVLDNGFRTFRFRWQTLAWRDPTTITASRGLWTWWGLRLVLTTEQAERVREFIGDPRRAELDLASVISVYDPR